MNTIAYASPYIPAEWIAAHGLHPLRLQPEGPASNGPIPPTSGICPYMRTFINQAIKAPNISAIVLTTVCDQMRRGYDLIHQSDMPTFCFNVPSTWQTESALHLYQSELDRFSRFLVSLGGTCPNDSQLATAMQDTHAKRQQTLHLQHVSQIPPNTIPVAITGGPRTKLDNNLLSLITKSGGSIVLDATEQGLLGTPPLFDLSHVLDNPRRELVKAYHQQIPGVSKRPNDPLHTWLAERISNSKAAGVILLRYLWCDLWHAEVTRIRAAIDVPLLDVDLDGEDPIPRNQTRIQAFIESLQA
jgi:benzoyl-CoA reductase/2-hydroxyglutaryl-CoA dehydratase subunit BcrC/BadD/HgdB